MNATARFRSAVVSFLERQDKNRLLILGLSTVGVLGLVDYATGYEVAFAIFYTGPVALVAYFVGRGSAQLICLLSASVWLLADLAAGHHYLTAWAPYWNAFTRFVFFMLVAGSLIALREAYDHQRTLARSDFLTGAANSRAFYEVAEMELVRAHRYGRPFSLAHIDVDNFKTVNDTMGHHAGDELLRTIVSTIKNHLRETDVVARLGGDEFVVLLPETAQAQASAAVQKLHGHLSEEVKHRGWPVSFSVGLLTCLDAPKSVDELLKRADKLTYDAKHSGKNAIRHDVVQAQLVSIA